MPGYLDQYGVGEERREKLLKGAAVTLIAIVVVGGLLFFWFKNFRQEGQVKRFFDFLGKRDYQSAYAMWGCTDARPCRDYPFTEFMRDWGPEAGKADGRVNKSRSCGSGVIVTVRYPAKPEDKLWVERESLVIGYSPWPGCPAGR